jgi:hypothetical protein
MNKEKVLNIAATVAAEIKEKKKNELNSKLLKKSFPSFHSSLGSYEAKIKVISHAG